PALAVVAVDVAGVVGRVHSVLRPAVRLRPDRVLVAVDAGGTDLDHPGGAGGGRIGRRGFATELARVRGGVRAWNLSELRLLDLGAAKRVLLQLLARDGTVLELAPVDRDRGVTGTAERDKESNDRDDVGERQAWLEPSKHEGPPCAGRSPLPGGTLHH